MALYDALLGRQPTGIEPLKQRLFGQPKRTFGDILGERLSGLQPQVRLPLRPPTVPQQPARQQPVELPQEPIPVRLPGTSPFVEGLGDPRIRASIASLLPPAAVPLGLPPAPTEAPRPAIDVNELNRLIANFLASYLPRATGISPAAPGFGSLPVNTGPQ